MKDARRIAHDDVGGCTATLMSDPLAHSNQCNRITAALERSRDEALAEAQDQVEKVYAVITTLGGREAFWIPADEAQRAIAALRGQGRGT